MKKVTVVLLACLLIVMFNHSLAEAPMINEDFTIRNGIHFGMTHEEVQASEKAYGTSDEKTYEYTCDETYNPTNYATQYVYVDTTILGYPGSNVSYFFDDDGNMMSFSYALGKVKGSGVSSAEAYTDVNALLTEKYGTPFAIDKAISEEIVTCSMSEDIFSTELSKAFGQNCYVKDIRQWVVKYNDCYVLIDLYVEKMFSDSPEVCHVGYRVLPSDIGNELQSQQEVNEGKRQTDI